MFSLKKLLSSLLIAASFVASVPFVFAASAADQSSQLGQNLLTYSEQFDNAAWTKSAATISANAVVAPDGTMTADKVTEQVVTSFPVAYLTPPATNGDGKYTFSAYFKDNTRQYVHLYAATADASVPRATFDLVGGTVTFTAGTRYLSSSIIFVGNGWYRCSLTFSLVGTLSYAEVMLNNVSGDSHAYLGDTTKSAYVWGAQLNIGNKASPYNRVTASTIGSTYTPTGASQSSQKGQNLLTYSEQFDNAAWTPLNATIGVASTTAPNGTLTGEAIISSTLAVVQHRFYQVEPASVLVGQNATFSIYVKAGAVSYFKTVFDGSADTVFFSLSGAGSVSTNIGTARASIRYVGNGWYRCAVSAVPRATSSSNVLIFPANGGNNDNSIYAAGDTTSAQIYVWGAQYNRESKPSAYNHTVASTINSTYIPAGVKQSSAKGQNYILQSQKLGISPWVLAFVTSTVASIPAPDGSYTATLLTEDNTTNAHTTRQVTTPTSGKVVTYSVYVKAKERTWAAVYARGGGVGTYVNLSNCTAGTHGGVTYINSGVQALKGGWCRAWVTFTDDLGGQTVYMASGDLSAVYAGDGVSGIYAWGAQTELGTKMGAYNRTGASAVNP